MNKVDGKIAVITGGTQGLGAAIAMELATAGAAGLITCGRNREKGESVAQGIQRMRRPPRAGGPRERG